MISRYLSDLRGTLRSAFGIQDANLTRDTNGLALDNDLWFGDGKGTVGDFYNIGTAAASQHVSFGTNGSRQHMALGAGGGPYTFSASFPPGGGICLLTIQNDSGAEQTPTWGSMFEFGQAGPPVIPDGSECCVLFACNGADLLHGVHSNSPSDGGSSGHSPGCVFSNVLAATTVTSEIQIPYGGTIEGWTIVGDVAGSVSITVSRATYANYDTMTSLFTATCTTSKKAQASGLSHAITAGDILRFSASGFASFARCAITLEVT